MNPELSMTANLGKIMQHGIVVSSLEAAVDEWAERVGVGPFYLVDITLEEYIYRGKSGECDLRLALSHWGDMQIELIEPVGAAVTLYSDVLPSEDGKLNHYGILVEDIDKAIDDTNMRDLVLQSGCSNGTKFVYLEKYVPGGYHLELIQLAESSKQAMSAMITACGRWDGSRPLRSMSELAEDIANLRQ
jgi:hypothetical protein